MNKLEKLERLVNSQQILHNGAPVIQGVRSGPSPETSFAGWNFHGSASDDLQLNPLKPGAVRTHWLTPINAIRSQVVSQKSSASPTNSSQQGAFSAGLVNAPVTTLAALSTVPDLSVALQTDSTVLVNMQGSFIGPSSATATFALYRDGLQIGRAYPHVPAQDGKPFLVNLSAIDTPTPGTHAYAAQWAISSGTLTAAAYARSIDAMNHRPA